MPLLTPQAWGTAFLDIMKETGPTAPGKMTETAGAGLAGKVGEVPPGTAVIKPAVLLEEAQDAAAIANWTSKDAKGNATKKQRTSGRIAAKQEPKPKFKYNEDWVTKTFCPPLVKAVGEWKAKFAIKKDEGGNFVWGSNFDVPVENLEGKLRCMASAIAIHYNNEEIYNPEDSVQIWLAQLHSIQGLSSICKRLGDIFIFCENQTFTVVQDLRAWVTLKSKTAS